MGIVYFPKMNVRPFLRPLMYTFRKPQNVIQKNTSGPYHKREVEENMCVFLSLKLNSLFKSKKILKEKNKYKLDH